MAAKKSALNSKLGRVSQIRFCTAAGRNMATRIYTQESAAFTVKVGCRQPSKRTDPYQVQYRLRSRYTAANSKKKGADWTKWSGWKNMVAFGSGSSKVALGSTKDPDTWLRPNKGVNKKSSYMTFYEFKGAKVSGLYDARQYQVRIRTYNAKTRKHGAWVTQTLSVYKAAVVRDETIHRGAGGQLMLDCNYAWDRGGTVHVAKVVDSTGRDILAHPLTRSMGRDSQRTAASTPPLRAGYVPGEFEVGVQAPAGPPVSDSGAADLAVTGNGSVGLKRALEYGEELTWDAYYQTGDGAKTRLKSPITVSKQDTSIDRPRVTASQDRHHGWVTVRAYKTDADDVVETAACTCSYTYRGKDYTVKPAKATLDLGARSTESAMAAWVFKDLPLNTDLAFEVTVGNDYHSTRTVKAASRVEGRWWLLSKVGGGSSDFCALQFNRELAVTSRPKVTTGLPHGRGKPFAAYMRGDKTEMTLSGVVVDRADAAWNRFATLAYVDRLRGNQGIYLLRGPRNGEMYTVAVTEVSRRSSYPDEGLHEVTVQMTEVS